MTTLKEDIEKKLAIRKFARENMGMVESENVKKTVAQEYMKDFEIKAQAHHAELVRLKTDILNVQRYAVQSEYWELKSSHKIIGQAIVFAKKVLRKLQHVTMGWFIQHLLDQQTRYNQNNVSVLNHVWNILEQQKMLMLHQTEIMDQQKNEIERLKADKERVEQAVRNLNKILEEQKEELQAQREEYLTMFRYYNKIS